jgi:hypothetical protein
MVIQKTHISIGVGIAKVHVAALCGGKSRQENY